MDKRMRGVVVGGLLLVGVAAVSVTARAQDGEQTPPGYGYGPGYGMGPGMMGGYGGWGMGPGMMGGYGGYGMGPGMMGGYGGGWGMGPGMMGGVGPVWLLDLSTAQRDKIVSIQNELRNKNWATMGRIMDEYQKLAPLYDADTLDAKQIGAVYSRIFDLRKQMIEAGVEAENRELALLTKEQREQLRSLRRGGYPGTGPQFRRGMMNR